MLSDSQLGRIRKKGYGQLIAGICFLILVPLTIIMGDMQFGVLMIAWLIFGLFFAGVYLYAAYQYLSIKSSDQLNILSLQGKIKVKASGKRHVIVTLNERSFFMMVNESASLTDGKEFILYYLEKPKVVIGWNVVQQASLSSESEIHSIEE